MPGDVPLAADYDGNGLVERAVFRPSTGTWYIQSSSNSSVRVIQWGQPGDEPI
jgi:hypothetical protein